MKFSCVFLVISSLANVAHAQLSLAREAAEEALEQIFRRAGEDGLNELTEMGGRTAIHELVEHSVSEGGDC